MSLSDHVSSSTMSLVRQYAADYLPDVPPSLAVWLTLRTEQVDRYGLPSFHRRCIICEQYMCTYWTEICDERVEWLTKERAQERLAELTPQPHLRRRFSEGPIERSVGTPQLSALQRPIMCLPPNPKVSNLSAQLTQRHAPNRLCQPPVITKGTPPKFCRWDETYVHTCCSPMGSCNIAVQILTPGCWHMIGQDCLHQCIILGRNWCRFCGMVWFKEEKSKTTRMALLKERYEGRADHVELWGAMSEREDCLEVKMEDGTVRRGEWKGILVRELERVILGRCERQKHIDLMREEVLRMDPDYVHTWNELKEGLEKQYCNAAVWKVSDYAEWDP